MVISSSGSVATKWLPDQQLRRETNMLVLTRAENERIKIGDDITIVVVELRGDKVRLGIEAPRDIPVHRQEVYDAIIKNSGDGFGEGILD